MNNPLKEGWQAYDQGDYPRARQCAGAVLTLKPGLPAALALSAMADLWLNGDAASSLRQVKRAVDKAPGMPLLHHSLGTLYAFTGDLGRAEAEYETALELNPDYLASFFNLTQVRRHTGLGPLGERMLKLAETGQVPEDHVASVEFGLAKIFTDLGEHDRAFAHAEAGNAAAPGHYSPKQADRYLQSLIELEQSGDFAGLEDSGLGSEKPFFIVGLPRSGTTLAEHVLAQHSRVRPMDELPDIIEIETALTKAMSARAGRSLTPLQALVMARPGDLRPHAEAMLEKVHKAGRAPYRIFTDKMPPNGLRLGLIWRLFPNARIAYMRRDPFDCALSNFFARLPPAYAYTRRLDWFGHYARHFEAVVAVWRRMLPLRLFDLNYEKLVTGPEPVIRDLLGFAGLDFEPACLHPELNGAAIKTASLFQARQAINASSVGRARRYRAHLGPLEQALGQTLAD